MDSRMRTALRWFLVKRRRVRRQQLQRRRTELEMALLQIFNDPAVLGAVSVERNRWWVRPRSHEWVKRLITSAGFEGFYGCFRMNRESFDPLLEMVREKITRTDTNYRSAIPAHTALSLFLYHVAHGVSYSVLEQQFGVGKSTCYNIMERVANGLCELRAVRLLDCDEMAKSAAENEKTSEIPQCPLIIDGTHIPILKPSKGGDRYYNRKGYYSTVLHAAIDSRLRFRDVVVGCPGSAGDSGVFPNSFLGRQHPTLLVQAPIRMVNTDDNVWEPLPMYILGDSAYVNTTHLVTTYEMTNVLANRDVRRTNRCLSATCRIGITAKYTLVPPLSTTTDSSRISNEWDQLTR